MVSISINIPRDDLEEIEEIVENSLVYENRSHYFRVAYRTLQQEDGEFQSVE